MTSTVDQKATLDRLDFESIEVYPLTAYIGAELRERQPGRRRPRRRRCSTRSRRCCSQYKVLFFRDQDITRAEHVALAERFGPLEDHPVAGATPSTPGWSASTRTWTASRSTTRTPTTATRPGGSRRRWAACCGASTAPAVGGDTIWVNMAEAYDRAARAHQGADRRPARAAQHRVDVRRGHADRARHALNERVPGRRAPGRAHPPGDRREGAVRQRRSPRTSSNFHRPDTSATGSTSRPARSELLNYLDPPGRRSRSTRCAGAGRRTASPSGTTAAPSTTPSRTTGRPSARWSAPESSATADLLNPPHSAQGEPHALPRRLPLPGEPGEAGHHRGAVRPRMGAGRLPRGHAPSRWTSTSRRRSTATTPAPPCCTSTSASWTARAPSACRSSTSCSAGCARPCRR